MSTNKEKNKYKIKRKNFYEITTYLFIHLVDKKNVISRNVWLALKESIRYKFSDYVNDTLLFFDKKLFVSNNFKLDKNYLDKKNSNSTEVHENENLKSPTKNTTFMNQYHRYSSMSDKILSDNEDMEKNQIMRNKTLNNMKCNKLNVEKKKKKIDNNSNNNSINYNNKYNNIKKNSNDDNYNNNNNNIHNTHTSSHKENNRKSKKNGNIGRNKEDEKKEINEKKYNGTKAKESNEESDNNQSNGSKQSKNQKINMHYYKLLIEIFIPLIICIDTKVSYNKNLFTELNNYLYANEFHLKKFDNFFYKKREYDELYEIFFNHLKLNIKNINNVYRAYTILLNSRRYFDKKLWDVNIPINDDVIKMIKEYELKNTKSRAEHVLFGDLKNYAQTKKIRIKKDNYSENVISRSFTTVITNSILNTLSETLNYSYDNFFFNNDTNMNNDNYKTIKNRDTTRENVYQSYYKFNQKKDKDYDNELLLKNKNNSIIESYTMSQIESQNESHNISQMESQNELEDESQMGSHNGNNPTYEQKIKKNKRDSNTYLSSMKKNTNKKEENDKNLFHKQLKLGLKKNIIFKKDSEYNENHSVNSNFEPTNENYNIFISSSEEEELPISNTNEDISDVNEYVDKELIKKKIKKIQLLNKSYNFVNHFKNIQNLEINENLIYWIEMLIFLNEKPPELISTREIKVINFTEFFESSLICALTVIKFVSLTLNCKKLYKITLKYLRNTSKEAEPNITEEQQMEEIYFIHLLSISTKLEALCSSISKQLIAFLENNKIALHFPIIKSLSILSILKPSA